MKIVAVLSLFTTLVLTVQSAQNKPPSITFQAPSTIYYHAGGAVVIPCKATGDPKPGYQWTKNNRKLDLGNDNRITQLPDEGTILIDGPDDKDEGVYQCKANNSLGISTTGKINLRVAKFEDFPKGEDMSKSVARGKSVKLSCTPPVSVPAAEIKWALKTKEGKMKVIELNNRITQDFEGNLYITNVREEDRQGGNKYVCIAENKFMRKSNVGPGIAIIPTGNTEQMVQPHLLWSSPKELEVVGVLGDSLKIKCIYGGNPTPVVTWMHKKGPIISDNRRTLSSGGQELLISTLIASDAGWYSCYTTGSNGKTKEKNIFITVKYSEDTKTSRAKEADRALQVNSIMKNINRQTKEELKR